MSACRCRYAAALLRAAIFTQFDFLRFARRLLLPHSAVTRLPCHVMPCRCNILRDVTRRAMPDARYY